MLLKTTYLFVMYLVTLLLLFTTPDLQCFANEIVFPTASYEEEELANVRELGKDYGGKENIN